MLTIDELKHVLNAVNNGNFAWSEGVMAFYEGKVVPKGRPRKGKNGRMFTPPETRKFEADVAKWGKNLAESLGLNAIKFPISVKLEIWDQTDNYYLQHMSSVGLSTVVKKDLDNMAKSILDGLNGVWYKDDDQITDLHITRVWSRVEGFQIEVRRAGLTKTETANMIKLMKASYK